MTEEHPNYLEYKKPGDFHDLETLRHQAKVLQPLDLTVDIDRLGAFAPTDKVEIGAITEQLGPGSGGGLQVSADLSRLDDGLRQLREQEANAKLRRLLEQAQQKMKQAKYQTAIILIDQALTIDQTSAPALLLKGQCYFALGDFDNALELLAEAQKHASDPQTAVLVLALRAVCERAAMQQFEGELLELLNDGLLDEALGRVERRLRRQPNNVTLLYFRCTILLSAGRLRAAKAAAERALDVVGEANVQHFQKLLHHIAVQDNYETLEAARRFLRQGDGKRAVAKLETCSAALGGDEQFEALRSYAYESYAHGALLGLTRWARTRRANVQPLDGTALQNLLCWLVQEELQEGVKALNGERFDKAKWYFAAAGKIDGRSNVVAFLHAVALFNDLQQAFEREKPPTLDGAYADLQLAARLAGQALLDPVVGEQSKALATAIDADLRVLNEIRVRIEKARAVSQCVSRFNTLVTRYERSPIRSMPELTVARLAFRQLANDVNGLRREHTPDSEEGRVLEQLARAIRRIEAQLAG